MHAKEYYDELATTPSPPNKRRKVVPIVSRSGMDNILASWGAAKSPTSVSKMNRVSGGHELRGTQPAVSYAESPPTSPGDSDRSSIYDVPQAMGALSEDEPEESDEEDELTSEDTIRAVPRGTLAAARPQGNTIVHIVM